MSHFIKTHSWPPGSKEAVGVWRAVPQSPGRWEDWRISMVSPSLGLHCLGQDPVTYS